MWTAIIGLFTGQLPGIVREIFQARADVAKSQTERERVAAEERVKSLEARRDFLISNNRWAMYLIAAVLAPFVIYIWWLVGWDKIACKWFNPVELRDAVCSTDPLSPWLTATFGSILTLLTLKKV
jgi:hypothetical protein